MLKLFPTFGYLFAPWRTSPTQRRVLLRLIAAATEQRHPLPPLLEAWSDEESGAQSIRLRRLAAALREGAPLANAIERFPGLLSDEQTLMIRFAAESGTLGSVIRRELEDSPAAIGDVDGNLRRIANYLGFFLLVGAPVALFIQTAITPQIEQIYSEFQIDLPDSTQLAIGMSSLTWWTWVIGALLLIVLLWSRSFSWPAKQLRRTVAPRLLSTLRSRRIGLILKRLGDSVAAGRPLSGAISTLARYHYDPLIRHKLLFARNELELGTEVWSALGTAGLLQAVEANALTAADQTGTRAWTLRTLGEARLERSDRRLRRQAGLMAPLIVLAFGVFVLVQATGMFAMLVHLIECLT